MAIGDDKSGGFGFAAGRAKQLKNAYQRLADIWETVETKAHADAKALKDARKKRKAGGGARKSP
jgi:hypothetical protein